jgi:dipeptidyl aminopeptidase/acylaminoacyl peptidase
LKEKAIYILLIVHYFICLSVIGGELPLKNFSQLPSASKPSLSPNGKQVAFIANFLDPELSMLTTMDLNTRKRTYLLKSDNENVKINWFTWANDKTLIISTRYASGGIDVKFTETRLIAVDIDDKELNLRYLVKRGVSARTGGSQFQDNVISLLPDDPEHILIAVDHDIVNMPSVYKVNIYTVRKERLVKGNMFVRDWMADRQGRVRLGEALNYKNGEAGIRIRIGDDDKWHHMFEHNALEESGIIPLGFAKDPNTLFYRAYNGDKKALYKIDLLTKKSTLVFEDPDYDVDGSLIYSRKTNDVIGINHANTKSGRIYWDKKFSKFVKAINRALSDTNNYIVDFSDDENIYLLYNENDVTPGAYFVGNRKEKSLELIFEQYPALSPEFLTSHDLVSYNTRDGTKIEGYLTLPKSVSGPVATILHPHGGPGARESDGFDYWTSFFTNRGYAVFRPNFRGSSGYGYAFAQSQMKGWGLTMQDDLSDAALWLIEQKIADPNSMCIVGASYGGYAAAMAAVKTPDLFKCAISFAGVSDLKSLVRKSRRFTNSKFVKQQIGDSSNDLEARSPYYNAQKIKIPILLLHGQDDRVVDVEQSREFAEELHDLGKSVEYIEFENGDHYLSIQRNRHAAFKAMDRFLKQHLK